MFSSYCSIFFLIFNWRITVLQYCVSLFSWQSRTQNLLLYQESRPLDCPCKAVTLMIFIPRPKVVLLPLSKRAESLVWERQGSSSQRTSPKLHWSQGLSLPDYGMGCLRNASVGRKHFLFIWERNQHAPYSYRPPSILRLQEYGVGGVQPLSWDSFQDFRKSYSWSCESPPLCNRQNEQIKISTIIEDLNNKINRIWLKCREHST